MGHVVTREDRGTGAASTQAWPALLLLCHHGHCDSSGASSAEAPKYVVVASGTLDKWGTGRREV